MIYRHLGFIIFGLLGFRVLCHIFTRLPHISPINMIFSLKADALNANIDGLVLGQQNSIAESISRLIKMLGLTFIEEQSQLLISDNDHIREQIIHQISTDNLVWDEDIKDYKITRLADTDIANNVEFIYNNTDENGDIDVYNISHPSAGFFINKAIYNNLGVFIDERKAHINANRLLSEIWSNRLLAKFYLNASYAKLKVGDKISFIVDEGEAYLLQINTIIFDRNRFYIEAIGYGQNFVDNLNSIALINANDVAVTQATELIVLDVYAQ